MATLTEPSAQQLLDARNALRNLVLPYRYNGGEAPTLWRTAHAALCQIEAQLGIDYTIPPRDERRQRNKPVDTDASAMLE